ncbi:Sensory histidine kinase/phosphatase NtrB [BD1-7 clade bacterium]|uniref:Sensory histidine kinase/phosphatase NtrB n=1 Tax=BD1-7 clade bacterium TaxID=2029982 RepID=A0A5S9Q9N5_9GAMM|nr:Sensory histidine kinase/phosphatase NtrB [BD1-7 clade bacterium]
MKLAEPLYRSIFDNMHIAVLLVDDEMALRYMNASAESLLQISAQRQLGARIDSLFSENGAYPEGLVKAISERQRLTKRKTLLRLPNLEEISVNYTVTPFHDQDSWFLMEIEQLDRVLQISQEEMLVSSQAVAQHMIRGLAHEIKNPLGGLRGAAQLLERELDNDEHREYTDIIIQEADRLRNLVDRLLGPHKSMQMESLNILEVLEYVRKLVAVECPPHIRTLIDYDPSIPNICGDREQLVQAMLNIMRNAMQALSDQEVGVITLRTRIQRKFTIGNTQHNIILRVDITDNGPGIPADLVDNLFFPMVSGRAEGTGLGLSIAQSVVNRHNGLIKFETQRGETTFSIFLPLEPINE